MTPAFCWARVPSVNASLEGAFEQRTVNKTGRVTVKRSLYAPTDASFGAHVSAVIASGADLDVRDDDGMPLLLLATLRRDHRAVRELLVAGANPSLSGKAYFVHSHDNGFPQLVNRWTPDTPWQLAVHLRELPVMKALLDANADTTNRKESVLAVNMVMRTSAPVCRPHLPFLAGVYPETAARHGGAALQRRLRCSPQGDVRRGTLRELLHRPLRSG